MAKKIIERILKVINIIVNLVIAYVSFASCVHYGTNGYMYSDDVYRIIWIVVMFIIVNIADGFIRKVIKEF